MSGPASPCSTRLPPERYVQLIRTGSLRLSEVAKLGLDAEVPSCPGWRVRDLLSHVAEVYQEKIACMREHAAPDPWPLPEFAGRDPQQFFVGSTAELLRELQDRGPDAPSYTWWPEDQSVGFWFRRMAHEIAVHRYDAELAHDVPTPIDPALALDGIDEALRLWLGGPWWTLHTSAHPVDASVRVDAAGRSWWATVRADSVVIVDESEAGEDLPAPTASVSGGPEAVLLWLWGRRDDALTLGGDLGVVGELRARLAEATA